MREERDVPGQATAVFGAWVILFAFLVWGVLGNRVGGKWEQPFPLQMIHTVLIVPGYVFESTRAYLLNNGVPMLGYYQMLALVSSIFWVLAVGLSVRFAAWIFARFLR